MSSSDPDGFVADLFVDAAASPRDQTEVAWSLDDFRVDDLFGDVSAVQAPLASHFASPAPAAAIDAEELARLEAEAFARGRAEGERAGFARGDAAARDALQLPMAALQAAAAQLTAGEQRWLSTLEENVTALAVAVAQHVIGREIAQDPATILPLVQQAVATFPLDQPLTLRVHPDDVAVVQDALPAVPGTREVRISADPNVMRGGALIEGRERIVDGRVDTALERVFRAISQVQA